MLLQSIEKINGIVNIFNSISIAVNGGNADILNIYDDDLKSEDELDIIYGYTKYISHLNFLKKNLESAKKGDYKSQVSERMKLQLINSIDITKNNITQQVEEMGEQLSVIEINYSNRINEIKNKDEIIQTFNAICYKFIAVESLLPIMIIRECKDLNLAKILSVNLKLIIYKKKPIEIRKFEKVVNYSNGINDIKNITYPKFLKFDKILNRSKDIRYLNIEYEGEELVETDSNEEKERKKCIAINALLSKGMGRNLDFESLDDIYKTSTSKLINKWREDNSIQSTIIILLNVVDKDFIYTLDNILNSENSNRNDKISGITKQYVEKTNTIFPEDKSKGVFYISPISIKKAEVFGVEDIMEQTYDYLVNTNIVIIKINENSIFRKSGIYSNIKLIDSMDLINPQLFNVNNELYRNINNYSIDKIKNSIEEIVKNRDRGDMNVFIPVKLSDIRSLILEKLKPYKRNENKLENTNHLISILFSSIYEAIWNKTPKTKSFSDEFYITFYASVNRLVFKSRKDIMDKYNFMRSFENAKEVVMDVLEKMEKNILKADEMITIKYNLII